MPTSSAAKSIARAVNAAAKRNSVSGFLVFDLDGNGGAHYCDGARPDMTGNIRINLDGRKVTAAQMEAKLRAAQDREDYG